MKNSAITALAKWAKFEWRPDQKMWVRSGVVGKSVGATGALLLLSKIFGISAVIHSSGGLILTGSAGYIAGTFIGWSFIWLGFPIVVLVGVVALIWKSLSTTTAITGSWIWNKFTKRGTK